MKILHINDNYCNLGGAEKYLLDTCSELEKAGNQVVIISSCERGHITVKGRTEYFVSSSYGVRSAIRIWKAFEDIIKKEEPDIIHLHNTHYFVSPFIIKKLYRIKPVVKYVHDARFFCPSLGRKIINTSNEICRYPVGINCFRQKGCYPFCQEGSGVSSNLHKFFLVSYELRVSRLLDMTTVGSRYMYDELVRNGFLAGKIRTISCYTDKNPDSKMYKVDKGPVLCIGRFDGVKGIPQFVEAMNFIRDQEWCAEIVGDGMFRREVEERIRRLGLARKVKLLGRLSSNEIDQCFQRCSMVVVPSMIPESFGMVGIEAMAFGKPVVAFDSGGIKEWLKHEETGFLVERGNVPECANRVSQLLKKPTLAMSLGENGMKFVEKRFRPMNHIKALLDIYQEVIKYRSCRQVRQ